MKHVYLFALSCLAVLATGCQKKSGNIWEDNQTGAKYSHQNSAALWGQSGGDENSLSADEEFLALRDEDLKPQFGETVIPQSRFSLGEGGIPGVDEFGMPTGELAAVFHPLFFNTDEHTLKSKESLAEVQRMAAYLKDHPNVSLIVEGHCDERGPEAYNQALGSKRANYIRSLFLKQGVSAAQVHTISFGKEKPFASGHNPDAWAQNRRAHFRVHSR